MLFVSQARFIVEPLLHVLFVSTSAGVDVVNENRIKDWQVIVARRTISVDLKVVRMIDFDVILGIDLLAENYASMIATRRRWYFRYQPDHTLSLRESVPTYESPQK